MDSRQTDKYHGFKIVHEKLADVPLDPIPRLFVQSHDALGACIERIETLTAEQRMAAMAVAVHVRERVAMLRVNQMQPLARVASPLLRYAPGAEDALRVPHKRARAAVVAEQAVKMATFLEAHANLLADAEISREFLEQFRAEADVLANATTLGRDARQRLSSATRGIREELEKGRAAVTVMYGLLVVHLGAGHVLVEELKMLMRRPKRIGRPPKKRPRRRSQPPA